jgi:hypothetical protein
MYTYNSHQGKGTWTGHKSADQTPIHHCYQCRSEAALTAQGSPLSHLPSTVRRDSHFPVEPQHGRASQPSDVHFCGGEERKLWAPLLLSRPGHN